MRFDRPVWLPSRTEWELSFVFRHTLEWKMRSFVIFYVIRPVVFIKIMKELNAVNTTSCVIQPNNINLIHRGRAAVSVSVRCLVLVKIYGNNPRKRFVKIIRNNDVRINEFPLFSFDFLKIVFIYWCSLFIRKLTIVLFHYGINQILVGINSSPIAVLVHFNGRLLFCFCVWRGWIPSLFL
jgi:hypothetical protein